MGEFVQLRKRLRPTRGTLVAMILIMALVGFAAWQLLIPHLYESPGPLSFRQARSHSPIVLPASASNVRIATFQHWIQTVQYVRFDAPLADCIAHAKLLLPGEPERPISASEAVASEPPFNPGPFHDLTPFDLRAMKNGVQYGTGVPSQPCIWIDRDHGVFYYRMTD